MDWHCAGCDWGIDSGNQALGGINARYFIRDCPRGRMNSGSNEKMIIVNSALVYPLRSELRIEIGLPVEKIPQLY